MAWSFSTAAQLEHSRSQIHRHRQTLQKHMLEGHTSSSGHTTRISNGCIRRCIRPLQLGANAILTDVKHHLPGLPHQPPRHLAIA